MLHVYSSAASLVLRIFSYYGMKQISCIERYMMTSFCFPILFVSKDILIEKVNVATIFVKFLAFKKMRHEQTKQEKTRQVETSRISLSNLFLSSHTGIPLGQLPKKVQTCYI
jgi:hypothetical protein